MKSYNLLFNKTEKKALKYLVFILTCSTLYGCISVKGSKSQQENILDPKSSQKVVEEVVEDLEINAIEEELQQEDNLDVSGSYQTIDGLDINFRLEVITEDGNDDVVILKRTGKIPSKEKLFLEFLERTHRVAKGTILNYPSRGRIILKKTDIFLNSNQDSKDSISDSSEKISQFLFCSNYQEAYESQKKVRFNESESRNIELKINYCLSGTPHKDNPEIIEGVLSVNAATFFKFGDNGIGLEDEAKTVTFKYKAEKE